MDVVPGLISLDGAPAFRQAMETKETVVSLIAASQLGGAAGGGAGGRAHLFPLVGKTRVLGVMLAVEDGALDVYGLEVLLSLAAASLELRDVQNSTLIGMAASPPMAAVAPVVPDSARRFARMAVARWILENGDRVMAGRASGDLYGEMGALIDGARLVFGQCFMPGPDYLHEEILARLALGTFSLLGPGYPGTMGTANAV
jgi:hypothetical protein